MVVLPAPDRPVSQTTNPCLMSIQSSLLLLQSTPDRG
jgi:hypothetical protein